MASGNNNSAGLGFFDVINKGLETWDTIERRELQRDMTRAELEQERLLRAQQIRQQTNELQREAAKETAQEALSNPLLLIAGLLGVALAVSVYSR